MYPGSETDTQAGARGAPSTLSPPTAVDDILCTQCEWDHWSPDRSRRCFPHRSEFLVWGELATLLLLVLLGQALAALELFIWHQDSPLVQASGLLQPHLPQYSLVPCLALPTAAPPARRLPEPPCPAGSRGLRGDGAAAELGGLAAWPPAGASGLAGSASRG